MTTGSIDERVTRKAEEQRAFDEACRAAQEAQELRSLRAVADNGGLEDGFYSRPNDGPILGELKWRGWLDVKVEANPSGHLFAGVRDRVIWTVTPLGREKLEEAE